MTTYFNPVICTNHPAYSRAARTGAPASDPAGAPYVYRYSTLERFDVAQFDFSGRSAARGVEVRGGRLGRWRYEPRERVLRATLVTRDGRLEVGACGG